MIDFGQTANLENLYADKLNKVVINMEKDTQRQVFESLQVVHVLVGQIVSCPLLRCPKLFLTIKWR